MNPEVFTFERLQPGELIGRHCDQIDQRSLGLWRDIYGTVAGQDVPTGFAAVLVMRTYLAVVTPRPPGNIHRALKIHAIAPLPDHQPVWTSVTCAAKELRNGRRYVAFEVTVHLESGEVAVLGEIDMVWAA